MHESMLWQNNDNPKQALRDLILEAADRRPIQRGPCVEEVALACGISHQQAVNLLTQANEPIWFAYPEHHETAS